ncbi:chemotaxis protein CheW [Inhella sp.]|uniref:chemotaxis protein CheW n=1 Tax=Inhella sp. TaxID=1921806 RepID=UPI0035B29B21
MNPPSAPALPAAAGAHVHVRVGRCDVAIPVGQVRFALPLPAQGLTPLPRRSGALLGLVDAEGAAVPVVALERWLPMEAGGDPAQQRLLVLQHQDARVAVRVDAVLGVKQVPPGGLQRVAHGDDEQELFQSVLPAGAHGPALCLLEVARLMRLTQAWCAHSERGAEAAPPPEPPAPAAPAQRARRHAVFEIGTERWAVPIEALGQVVPVPAAELDLRRGELSWAIGQWQGRKLALVDLSTGGQASSHQQAPWMVLLHQGPLALGLTVSACMGFVDLDDDALACTPGDALLAGIAVRPEWGRLRVLEPAKLFSRTPEAAISLRSAAAPAAGAPSEATEPVPYLVFEADQAYATPVDGIVGVIELPPAARDALREASRTVMDWRGRAVHVVKLPPIAGPAGTPAGAMDAQLAVMVQPDAQAPPIGIAIKSLRDWLPAHSAERSGMRMGTMGELCLIHAKGSPAAANLVVVDLVQIAHLLG